MSQSCPLCKNMEKEFFLRAYDRMVPRQENFNYVRCGSCSLFYLDPIPDNMEKCEEKRCQSLNCELLLDN